MARVSNGEESKDFLWIPFNHTTALHSDHDGEFQLRASHV